MIYNFPEQLLVICISYTYITGILEIKIFNTVPRKTKLRTQNCKNKEIRLQINKIERKLRMKMGF